jgi:hypothetical protein
MDIGETTVSFRDSLGIVIQLGEDERKLIFNLHRNLQASAVVVRQDFDWAFRTCRPD